MSELIELESDLIEEEFGILSLSGSDFEDENEASWTKSILVTIL
jgi:hypothetical protein